MGKRSDFERVERDYYPTPLAALLPLVPHLPEQFTFAEPCAGDGRLIDHIEQATNGKCIWASDINPQRDDIHQRDALATSMLGSDLIITNTPWNRKLFHPMLEHFSNQRPTWLLHDSDWLFTKQAGRYLNRLVKTVTIGRVSWMENGVSGKDNCVWSLFDVRNTAQPQFFGRP